MLHGCTGTAARQSQHLTGTDTFVCNVDAALTIAGPHSEATTSPEATFASSGGLPAQLILGGEFAGRVELGLGGRDGA